MSAIRMRNPVERARRELDITDHEVIKAVESQMVEAGVLSAEFKAKRDALRARVRQGKPKPLAPQQPKSVKKTKVAK